MFGLGNQDDQQSQTQPMSLDYPSQAAPAPQQNVPTPVQPQTQTLGGVAPVQQPVQPMQQQAPSIGEFSIGTNQPTAQPEPAAPIAPMQLEPMATTFPEQSVPQPILETPTAEPMMQAPIQPEPVSAPSWNQVQETPTMEAALPPQPETVPGVNMDTLVLEPVEETATMPQAQMAAPAPLPVTEMPAMQQEPVTAPEPIAVTEPVQEMPSDLQSQAAPNQVMSEADQRRKELEALIQRQEAGNQQGQPLQQEETLPVTEPSVPEPIVETPIAAEPVLPEPSPVMEVSPEPIPAQEEVAPVVSGSAEERLAALEQRVQSLENTINKWV